MSDMLFNVPKNVTPAQTRRANRRANLKAIKREHGIETHRSTSVETDAWMAICRPQIVKALSGYETEKALQEMSMFDLFAGYCRLIEEWKLVAYGDTEAEAMLNLCRDNNIPADL